MEMGKKPLARIHRRNQMTQDILTQYERAELIKLRAEVSNLRASISVQGMREDKARDQDEIASLRRTNTELTKAGLDLLGVVGELRQELKEKAETVEIAREVIGEMKGGGS